MSRLFGIVALLLVGGCHRLPCKAGTLFLTLDFDAPSASADALDVAVTYDDGTSVHDSVAHTPNERSGTLEVKFDAGYPAARHLGIVVAARAHFVPVGAVSDDFVPDATCSHRTLAVQTCPAPADGKLLNSTCTAAAALDVVPNLPPGTEDGGLPPLPLPVE